MGVLAAITGAAGEQLNLLAGVRLSRVAQAAQVGDAELVLERTLGMDASGTVVVDNVTYRYSALRDGALGGLVVDSPQGALSGVQYAHRRNAVVTDATRSYSQLDWVRRALFVDTAEGPDLSTLGRMLGVLRRPELTGDTQYRQLIKAIAYSPRTTLYGLKQALDILVGAGNYSIIEDLENLPCTVIVAIGDTGFLTSIPWGKGFLSGDTATTLRDNAFAVPQPVLGLGAVHVQAAQFWADFSQDVPSSAVASPSSTQAAAPFAYVGADEAQVHQVPLATGSTGQKLGGSGYYHSDAALLLGAEATASWLCAVPDVTQLSATDGRRGALRLVTQRGLVGVGCVAQGGQVALGLCDLRPDAGSGALLQGVAATVAAQGVHELAVSVTRTGAVRLLVDGVQVQSLGAALATQENSAALAQGVDFGALGGVSGGAVALRAGLSAKSLRDYAALNATATTQSAQTLTLSYGVTPGDAGGFVTILDGGGAAATGGQARGAYPIATVLGNTVTLGPVALGAVDVAGSTLTSTAYHPPLRFPDDLGRTLTLSGSDLGNNMDVIVVSLIADDGAVLTDPTMPRQARCRAAGLAQPVTRAESGLSASAKPQLGTQVSASVVLNQPQLTLSGSTVAIAARTAAPFAQAAFAASTDNLLSAQVFEDVGAINHRLGDGPPPTYAIWPTYLADNQHFVETYLDDMLVAGVNLKVVSAEEYS